MRQSPIKINYLLDSSILLRTSPYIFIWALFFGKSGSMGKLRYYSAKIFWRNLPYYGFKRMLKIILYFGVWPYFFLRNIKSLGASPYNRVKTLTGKNKTRQLLEQFYQAVFYSTSPQEYFMYELYKKETIKNISIYYRRLMFKPLIYKFLEQVNYPREGDESIHNLNSKFAFDQMCRENGLACIPIFGRITPYQDRFYHNLEEIREAGALFFKPVKANVGRGAEMWEKNGDFYTNGKNEKLEFKELIKHFKDYKPKGFNPEFIMQPRITNHKDLDFKTKALSTVRIITYFITGRAEAAFAILRFSTRPDAVIDNFHAGGYAAKVNIDTGELGYASGIGDKEPGLWLAKHPVSQKQIKGLVLPYWHETRELALKAHRSAFQKMPCVGWDVAITNEGPLLVEGNIQPDNEAIQKNHGAFGEYAVMERFAKKVERDYKSSYKHSKKPA